MTSDSFTLKISIALNFCKEQRSAVNDIFYLSSLRHLNHSYLNGSMIPEDLAEKIKKTWYECYKSMAEEAFSLNDKSRQHLIYWQDLLSVPSFQLH